MTVLTNNEEREALIRAIAHAGVLHGTGTSTAVAVAALPEKFADAILAAGFRRPPVSGDNEVAWRKAIANQVRANCTLDWEIVQKGGDAIVYGVADWVENPPEWVPPLLTTSQPREVEVTDDVERAVQIGHDLVGLESAIDQGQIGFTNAGGVRHEFYDTPLFRALSSRRGILRHELATLTALGGGE